MLTIAFGIILGFLGIVYLGQLIGLLLIVGLIILFFVLGSLSPETFTTLLFIGFIVYFYKKYLKPAPTLKRNFKTRSSSKT